MMANSADMVTILMDSKSAISTLRKLDQGIAPPRPEFEARILKELCRRADNKRHLGGLGQRPQRNQRQ